MLRFVRFPDFPAATLTVAGLAQSVERLTAELDVGGSISKTRPLLKVLK